MVIKIKENIADKDKRSEVETTMKTIVIKMQSINALNEAILNDIAEDELEEDMEIATQFEIKISKETDKFREILLKYKEVNNATVKRS